MGIDPESSFELIQRAQAGDESAVDRLLARYRPRLQRWASGRLPRYAARILARLAARMTDKPQNPA
jgi:DNA-directed RNA polymerase specialized sigma24 family protein